ncbi:unnamed protein product, partial [Arabidopsis halleri]
EYYKIFTTSSVNRTKPVISVLGFFVYQTILTKLIE